MAIAVPRAMQDGLKEIASASDVQLETLAAFLNGVEPAIFNEESLERLYSGAAATLPFSKASFEKIVSALLVFHNGQVSVAVPRERFLRDLMSSDYVETEIPEDGRELLKRWLPRLVEIESLYVSSKATDVLFDCPAHFISARILTDVRPLFDDDANIEGTTIAHTLRIDYHEARDFKRFFVALDASDMDSLVKTLERAKRKNVVLSDYVTKTGVRIVTRAPKGSE